LLKYFETLMPTERDQILRGFEYPECGGLICTDEEMLNK